MYACDVCLTQISPMAGTIFEHSSTSLRLWYYAMYLMASTRCGISAKQIQRETGVTYKTAWRMFRQIRSLLSEPDDATGGRTVEMDETYVGGKRKGIAGVRLRGDGEAKDLSGRHWSSVRAAGVAPRCNRHQEGYACTVSSKSTCCRESVVFTDELQPPTMELDAQVSASPHQAQRDGLRHRLARQFTRRHNRGILELVKRGSAGYTTRWARTICRPTWMSIAFRYNRRERGI